MSKKTEKKIKQAVVSLAINLQSARYNVTDLINLCRDDNYQLSVLAPILERITASIHSLDLNAMNFGVEEDLL